MGLVKSAVRGAATGARASVTGASGIATPERWVVDWVTGGEPTLSGVRVDEETALHYSAFFAGVRVIAEDVASLPLHLYERLERGKRRATEHPLYGLLHDAPNDLMTSMQLRETIQGHAVTWGTGWIYIVRDAAGRVVELWPLRPDRVQPVKQVTSSGRPGQFRLTYRYEDPANGIRVTLLPDEVLPVAGLGWDGTKGYSVVRMAAQSLGLALAAERYGAAFFGGGSRPGGVLQHPGELSPEAKRRLAADWEQQHRGLDRAQRVAILEEGMTWQQIGIPPEDAQFLETRRLQVTEAARWLRLPPHKVADLERATFANIEEQQIDYISSGLRVWLVRWEQGILARLLSAAERGRYFAEHLVDGLLRGNTISRYQAYAIGRQWGWLSANDVRELENANPIDGGDTYLVPLNMVPARQPPAEPAAEPERAVAAARALRGRGVEARRRIARSFRPLIADADERLAKLERAEVASLVRRFLTPRAAGRHRSASEFLGAVQLLYGGLIRERSIDRLLPILAALAGEVAADAAADVGHDGVIDLSRWIRAYVISHVDYRVASSSGQIAAAVDRTTDPDTLAAEILALMDNLVVERPARTAAWESRQTASGAAREAWREAGVRTLRWVTSGDTCPYCTGLDGKTVAITAPFAAKGDQLPGGDGQQLEVGRTTYHPPVHPGCDCDVVPA